MINDVPKKNHTPKPEAELQERLGLVVRTHRRQLGLTQDELAWRSNMHRTYIADIELGARNVTLRSIVNLAKALQLTVGSLVSFASATGVGAANAEAGEILLVEDSAPMPRWRSAPSPGPGWPIPSASSATPRRGWNISLARAATRTRGPPGPG